MTIELGDADREAIQEIKAELVRRTQTLPGQTRAIRWAVRELAAALKAAALMERSGEPSDWPLTPPPE